MFADGLAHVCHVAQDLISLELAYITKLTSRQKHSLVLRVTTLFLECGKDQSDCRNLYRNSGTVMLLSGGVPHYLVSIAQLQSHDPIYM